MKLTTKEKYCYGVGALGKDLVYALVSTFLMIYLSDGLGINTVFIGVLFFVARLWDAINDPIMGWVVENTKTRFGKFRPWILIGTLINAFVLVMLFNNPGLEGTALLVYVSFFYILWGMTYTVMDIPYWSFIPALSKDEDDRNELSVIPRVFASIGNFLVASCGLLFVNEVIGDYQKGFSLLSIIIAIAFIGLILITVIFVKEDNVIEKKQKKYNIKEVFQTLYKNDQLVVMSIVVVIYSVGMYLTTGFGIFYFKYDLGNENLFATFTIVAGVAQVLAMLIFPKLAKKFNKKIVFITSCILPIIGFAFMFLVGFLFGNSLVLLCTSGVILFLGFGFSQVLATVMLADTVEYGEYKLGYRSESIVFSMQPFVVKFASAVQGLVTGIGLAVIGYQENQIQTASTILGMRVIMFIIPTLLIVIALVIYLKFYKLNGAFYKEVLASNERKNKLN